MLKECLVKCEKMCQKKRRYIVSQLTCLFEFSLAAYRVLLSFIYISTYIYTVTYMYTYTHIYNVYLFFLFIIYFTLLYFSIIFSFAILLVTKLQKQRNDKHVECQHNKRLFNSFHARKYLPEGRMY